MPEQANLAAPPSQPLPGWKPGVLEAALGWAGVGAFAAFAAWSAWRFVTYEFGGEAAFFLDPRFCPNSILVQFTLGEYLETFGRWRGWGAMPVFVALLALGIGVLAFMMAGILAPVRNNLPSVWMGTAALCGTLALLFTALAALGVGDWGQLAWIPCGSLGFIIVALLLTRGGRLRLMRLVRCRRHRSSRVRAHWPTFVPLTLLLFLAFLSAATPAIQSDGLRYHLSALQVWSERGDLTSIDGLAFSHFPFLVEMWMGFGWSFAMPDVAAKTLHFALWIVCIGLVAGLTRLASRWAGAPPQRRRPASTLAVALVMTIPAFTIVSTWSFIDAGVVCFTLAAVCAHACWWHTGRGSHLVLAAVLTGLMMGTKYTAVVPAFVLGLGVLACGRPALRPSLPYALVERLVNGLVFGLIALALASPWHIRNWVQTGDPVYPLMNHVFEAEGWDAESQALWREKAAQKGVDADGDGSVDTDWWLLGRAFESATFQWRGGEGVGPGGLEDQSIGLTPWLLAPLGLSGLLLIALRRGGWWIFYVVFVAANFAMWFATYQSNRLLLPTLIVALPGAVAGLAWLTQRWRAMWVTALIALGAASTHQGLWIARHFLTDANPLQLALGFMDPDEWRSIRVSCFDGARAAEVLVPQDERILVIGESRRFHFPSNVVMSDWFDPPAVRRYLDQASTPERLSTALAEAGVTHVFLNHAELLPGFWQWRPNLLGLDGEVDAALLWDLWRRGEVPAGSNLWHFRRRFGDAQAALLAEWLATAPHEVIWRGDREHTLGVELWRLGTYRRDRRLIRRRRRPR